MPVRDLAVGYGEQNIVVSMVCVHCGNSARTVYVEYSPGNIRLSPCARCGATVDEYVEYETMIILIDITLHKLEAYRHLFFNYPHLHKLNLRNLLWKAALLCLLLDTCRCATPGVGKEEVIEWDTLTSFLFTTGKVVAQVGFLDCTFLFVLVLVSHTWPRRCSNVNLILGDIVQAVLLSSHFKLFVFAMMVWKFSPLMGFMVDMLVLSSQIAALKVMLKTTTQHSAAAVISGALVKAIMGYLLGL